MIYHITSRANWDEAQTQTYFRAPSLETEGFIHCSTRHQILGVADDLYRDQQDLLLLCIDEKLLHAPLVWEAPPHPKSDLAQQTSDDSLFPHIYGVLNLDAVTAAFGFREARSGLCAASRLALRVASFANRRWLPQR